MGVEIVKAAMVHGKRLSGNAYKVLVTMSMSALDKPKDNRPSHLYWGGWDALAVSLGYDNAERNSSGHVIVKRAIKELRSAGHISTLNEVRRGTAQTYMVHPGGLPKGEQSVPVKGEQSVPAAREQNVPARGNKTFPPRKNTGSSEDLSQDIHLPSATELQTARDDESDEMGPHKFEGNPAADECLACGLHYQNRVAHPIRLLRGTA